MPTRPAPLTAIVCVLGCAGVAAGADSLAPSFDRVRPGAVSAGPSGMPHRHADRAVEPASFQTFGAPRPIEPRAESVPVPPPVEQVAFALVAPADEPKSEVTPQPGPAPAEPRPLSVVAPPERPAAEGRRLPLAASPDPSRARRSGDLAQNPLAALGAYRPSSETLAASGAGLAIAVGLVFCLAWLARACAPKSTRPLPKEVIEVLGRAPLGAKQTAQLVRVGGKLLLVAVTPEGMKTLTEVSDPDEVARLVASCDAGRGRGADAEFDAMLKSMSDRRVAPGFLDTPAEARSGPLGFADGSFDPRALAAAYANTPGGRTYA